MVVEITKREAKDLVVGHNCTQFFTVVFIKRSTGKKRAMNCRKGVKKHLKGGVRHYDPAQHNLVCVYDMKAADYRSIALESIISIKMSGGKEYIVMN